jgi:enterochelin esterase-like enzyme
MSVLGWSTLTGPLPVVLIILALTGLVVLLLRPDRWWWSRVVPVCAVAAAALTTALVLVVDRVWHPFPDRLPLVVDVATGVGVLGIVLLAARLSTSRREHRRARLLAVPALTAATLAVVLGAVSAVNQYYGSFPTVGAAFGAALPNQVALGAVPADVPLVTEQSGTPLSATWNPATPAPAHGSVTETAVPGTRSGFAARPAWIYLPPAYLMAPRAQLPVLVLVSGQPGSPRDWFDGGRLAERLDAFAAAHRGLAPVVVVPDDLGRTTANPLCMDSRLGNVGTYLDVDVPAWIRTHLQVATSSRAWAVGGYSNGGTCALQTSLRSPQVYPTFLDISGQDEPTLGSRAATVQATFGGDAAAFAAVNPLDELTARPAPRIGGMLVAGTADKQYRPQAERVQAALVAADVPSVYRLLPGGHTWAVWGAGLDVGLPWLAARTGLTP